MTHLLGLWERVFENMNESEQMFSAVHIRLNWSLIKYDEAIYKLQIKKRSLVQNFHSIPGLVFAECNSTRKSNSIFSKFTEIRYLFEL